MVNKSKIYLLILLFLALKLTSCGIFDRKKSSSRRAQVGSSGQTPGGDDESLDGQIATTDGQKKAGADGEGAAVATSEGGAS